MNGERITAADPASGRVSVPAARSPVGPSSAPAPSHSSHAFITEWATDPSEVAPQEAHVPPPVEPVFTCASCHFVIRGPATFHVGLAFCCAGCVAGGPCTCSYDLEPVAAGEHLRRSIAAPRPTPTGSVRRGAGHRERVRPNAPAPGVTGAALTNAAGGEIDGGTATSPEMAVSPATVLVGNASDRH